MWRALVIMGLWGFSSCPGGSPEPVAAPEVALHEESNFDGQVAAPLLGLLVIVDLSPEDSRPVDLSDAVESTFRKSLGTLMDPADPEDPKACKGEVQVDYGLFVNDQAIDTSAKSGNARMVVIGLLHCPRQGRIESFKTEFSDQLYYGPGHRGDGASSLNELLARLSELTAEGLYGQLQMRHASDAAVSEALKSAQSVGLLMEAASEAGERKLLAASEDLARHTRNPSDAVALRAGAALGLLGDSRPVILRALAAMTVGPDFDKHIVAINALGDIGGFQARRYLETIAVGHPEEALRHLAREAVTRSRRGSSERPLNRSE